MADPFKDNVVLYLPMEGSGHGDTTILDKTGKTVTRNGDVVLSTAVVPPFGVTSAYFDGTGDYLSLADSSAWAFGSGDFTIEAWFYIATAIGAGAYPALVGQRGNYNSDYSWLLYLSTAGILFYCSADGTTDFKTLYAPHVGVGTWTHVAVTRHGDVLHLFVNGRVVATTTGLGSTALYNSTQELKVAATNTVAAGFFNGYIKDLRITKGVARYTGTFSISQTTTVDDDYWANTTLLLHCDGADGSTTFTDSSNSAHSITVVGNAHIEADQRKFGGTSVYFDGSGDALRRTSADFAFGTGDFTIEFWVWLTNGGHGGNWARIMETEAWPATGGFAVLCSALDNPAYIRFDVSEGNAICVTSAPVANSTWHHVAITRAGTATRLFLNGVQQGSTVANATDFSKQTLSIGSNNTGGESLLGYLDEIRITKGVARYTQNFTPRTAAFPDKATIKTVATPYDWDTPERRRILL